jgi:hypothetical protein
LDGDPSAKDLLAALAYESGADEESLAVQARAAQIVYRMIASAPHAITRELTRRLLDGRSDQAAAVFLEICRSLPDRAGPDLVRPMFSKILRDEGGGDSYLSGVYAEALGVLARHPGISAEVGEGIVAYVLSMPKRSASWIERAARLLGELNLRAPLVLMRALAKECLVEDGPLSEHDFFLTWLAVARPEWFPANDTPGLSRRIRALARIDRSDFLVISAELMELEPSLDRDPMARMIYELLIHQIPDPVVGWIVLSRVAPGSREVRDMVERIRHRLRLE